MRASPVLALLLLLGACDGKDPEPEETGNADDTGDGADEGLPEEARLLVAEALGQVVLNGSWVLSNGGQSEAPFAGSLLGTDQSMAGVASMFFPCTEPAQYDEWCEPSGLVDGVDTCTRFACVEEGVWGSETWFQGESGLRYAASTVDGEVIWGEGTVTPWSVAFAGENLLVYRDSQHSVVVELTSGESLDLSHSVQASLAADGHTPVVFDVGVQFTALEAGLLEASLGLVDGDPAGAVTLDGVEVGQIQVGEEGLSITWVD